MLTKRSFALAGHRTSVALEDEFWSALTGIAARNGGSLSALVARVDSARVPPQSLASALRIMALRQAGGEIVSEKISARPANPALD